ncbi:hypothetical protein N9L26_01735 [Candidatus Pacebacteria bacterium]|nr:hypothetical protein [Candidatus Paceibacterota bacterium]
MKEIPRHKSELEQIARRHGISTEDILIVGGGVLAVKGIRENNDLDFSLSDSEFRNKFYRKKKHDKYYAVTENIIIV